MDQFTVHNRGAMWGKIRFDPRMRYDGSQLSEFFGDIVLVFEPLSPIPTPPTGVELSIRSGSPLPEVRPRRIEDVVVKAGMSPTEEEDNGD